jgi:hypothetical protein
MATGVSKRVILGMSNFGVGKWGSLSLKCTEYCTFIVILNEMGPQVIIIRFVESFFNHVT